MSKDYGNNKGSKIKMHVRERYTWVKHLDFILIDLICLMISFVVAYYLKFENFLMFQEREWLSLYIIVCAINLILTLYINPYSGMIRRRYYEQFLREIPLLIYQVVIICIIFYAFKIGTLFSREMMFTMYFMYFFGAHILKYIRKRIIIGRDGSKYKKRKILVVGDTNTIDKVVENILVGDLIEHQIDYIYLVDKKENKNVEEKIRDIKVINNYGQLDIDEIFIATELGRVDKALYKFFNDNGVPINFCIESITGFEIENSFVQRVGNYQSLCIDEFQYDANQMAYFFLKRVIDIVCGLLGLIILIPVTIIIKIAYMLTGDFKPIFYTQKRIGKNGKPIHIFKFRSMVYNADEVLAEMLKDEKYKEEWNKNQKFEQDPRITKVGRFIRKTSIDEMPQFINLINGEMSLVGPRPLVEGELENHDGLKLYNKVKPGITGWWACNGRSNIEYRERLELEYYYVQNCSLLLDIICLLRTVLVVLKKEGAK